MSSAPIRQHSRLRYERRRQEIADIAARVFAERGYHGTSVSDLVSATGLQRGGLYHYINGKEELLSLVHHRFIEPLLEESRAVLAEGEPPDKTLRMLMHVLLKIVEQYRNQVTVFLREWRNIKDHKAWEAIASARKEYEDIVLGVLKRGSDEGMFSVPDQKMAGMALLGMINYTYQWFDPGGRVSADELADQMTSIFLHGVMIDR